MFTAHDSPGEPVVFGTLSSLDSNQQYPALNALCYFHFQWLHVAVERLKDAGPSQRDFMSVTNV